MAEHPTFDMGDVPPLPGPGDPVDPLRGSRIESIKRHPTDPELALVTRTNPDQVVGPFASVSVEFYDEAVAEGREWGLALEEQPASDGRPGRLRAAWPARGSQAP